MAVRELRSSPGMLPLFGRAAIGFVPGAGRLPFVGGGGGEVPDTSLVLEGVEVSRERLAAYDRVCGFQFGDTLPPTYVHMLAFPLQLALLTDGHFPLPAIGLVHIFNRIVQHRPIGVGETLSLSVRATPLEPHPRGVQFSLVSEARVGDELVWEEVSTNLRRGRGASEEAAAPPEVPDASELPATATWRLRGDLGRRYGAVSGDLNPIHIHQLTARLFGFRSAIAHGMWTKARCLAALGPRLPARFRAEVAFRKPILLPATVQFASAAEGKGIRFGVRDAAGGAPHLDGLVSP